MKSSLIEKSIQINAGSAAVWRVFTDPIITRQLGGEYITGWKAGDTFGWKGTDGKMHTHGFILRIEPAQLLEHTLVNPANEKEISSVITYTFTEHHGNTTLQARERLYHGLNEEEYSDASAGWDTALRAVKQLAEKL